MANVIKILKDQLLTRLIAERELSDCPYSYKKDTDNLLEVYRDELISQKANNIMRNVKIMDLETLSDYKTILNLWINRLCGSRAPIY